ncbi:helix-turn-helix domain-containing protein [Amycolatopsis alkalitolerans]|uniref:GAF domain-containing protein n=1 Tax=Amycolatopsis alkalitolerans TaxID=2547244 RepID=A0A5C4M5C7_9PSEU|nr:helix-turn-helix domain-containing protein [Amycolatopsis alkalitolerans]TNC25696.1 GAF domain-containing protein [Amycolatopsis alkalitolerans]
MTPSQAHAADRTRTEPTVTGELEALPSRSPDTGIWAARELAAAATRALGADATVLTHRTPCVTVLVGPSRDASTATSSVRAGHVEVQWSDQIEAPVAVRRHLQHACCWVSMALDRDSARERAEQAAEETAVLRDVVGQLLTVRDLDQVLLSIADRTLHLLDSDICGVLLVEGDQVAMRSCVGNRAVETARLRMCRGQGVAGLVFLTGEPAKVDNYLEDETISDDFMFLAEKEETLSALAVPLRLHGELIGVLEVWRRRPSVFTEQHVRRMVTLADFATIAIDNARLHDQQATAVAQMKETRDALEQQVALLARSSNLQQKLLETVLAGVGLPAIARTVATELGCRIGIYGPEGSLIASCGGRTMAGKLPPAMSTRTRPGRHPVSLTDGGSATAWLQPIYADGDQVGSVALLPEDHSAEMMDVVAGEVAMACSLTLLREHAASRARTEELEQVLWDLLQGPVEHRIAARARAKQLNVTLRGDLRVVYGRLDNLEEIAAENGWDTSQTDRLRREVLRELRGLDAYRGVSLSALRGDLITAVVVSGDRAAIKDLVSELSAAMRRQWPRLQVTWGVSRAHADVVDLPSALNEAKTALSAARRLGGENVFLYEELGIVRLLLGSGDDPDLQTFVDEVTGPLVTYDRDNGGALVRTLRAFFAADCSQRVAAERLFVHYKTLRYRLEQIKQLTGLDLARHEDRMRADFALRLLQVTRPDEEDGGMEASVS